MMAERTLRLAFLAAATLIIFAAAAARAAAPGNALDGTIVLSNKHKLTGSIFMTRGKMLRLFDPNYEEYRDFKLEQFSRITVNCTRKRIEREWYFKEEGSAEKIYTGRRYPRLDFTVTVTLKKGGRQLTSNLVRGQPVYIQPPTGEKKRFLLQPYLRGKIDQTPEQLVYMTDVIFDTPEDTDKRTDKQTQDKDTSPEKSEKNQPPNN